MKKIKIKVNGKLKTVNRNSNLLILIKNLKIQLKKVAIEMNGEIVNKKKLNRIILKNNDRIEVVHFIGGG